MGAVQDLLGHDAPPGDLEAVLKFSLRAAKQKLEQRKFAATERPRAGHQRSNPDGRHIPALVRRAVWQRDGEPYARGGEASLGGIRLLCRAHNEYEAERTFDAEFMRHRREAARIRASEAGALGSGSAASAGSPTKGQE